MVFLNGHMIPDADDYEFYDEDTYRLCTRDDYDWDDTDDDFTIDGFGPEEYAIEQAIAASEHRTADWAGRSY